MSGDLRAAREALARLRKCAEAGAPPAAPDAPPGQGKKVSQQQAHYGPAVTPMRSCAVCANFDGQSGCAVVEGQIDPGGTSDLFQPRPELSTISTGPIAAAPTADPIGTKEGAAAGTLLLPILGGIIGGGIAGGKMAPHGHKTEGTARGISRGRLAVPAGFLGAGLGAVAGMGLDQGLGMPPGALTLAGAGLGGGLGAYGGNALVGWALGPPSWHKDKKKYNPSGLKRPGAIRAAVGAGPAAMAAGGLGINLYPRFVMPHLQGKPLAGTGGKVDQESLQKLVDRVVKPQGVRAKVVPAEEMSPYNAGFTSYDKLQRIRGDASPEEKEEFLDSFAPGEGAVFVSPESRLGEATLAHEAGHAIAASRHPWLTDTAQGLGKAMQGPSQLATLAIPFMPSRKWALRTALTAGALQLPRVIDEAVASHYGGMGLSAGEHGMPGWGHYFSAYGGVPTYAASALLPLGAYGLARLLGRWSDRPDGRRGRDADSDGRRRERENRMTKSSCNNSRMQKKIRPHMPAKGRIPRRRKLAELLAKCACTGDTMCADCKAARKYREVRPERREGNARFAWRGRGAKDITDDPGYEKYTRKAAALALAAILDG